MKGGDFVDLSNIVKWRSKFIVSKGIVIRSVKKQILRDSLKVREREKINCDHSCFENFEK